MRASDPFSRPLPAAGKRRDLPGGVLVGPRAVEAGGGVPRTASAVPLAAGTLPLSLTTRQRLPRQGECSEKIDAHQAVFARLRRVCKEVADLLPAARIACQG